MEQDVITIDDPLIRQLIIPRPADGHKGTFGHALIAAGSAGKIGAAILCSHAALRSGCGLLSVYTIPKAVTPLLCQLPEAMIILRKKGKEYPAFRDFDAIGVGPGMGIHKESEELLIALLKYYAKPLVIDADAISLLSQQPHLYNLLSPQTILTPHPKEFDRLTRGHSSNEERFITQQEFSAQYHTNVVLKGTHTTITLSDGSIYRNTTGNDGMATAGSGDVLTGIITSLCAQGYTTDRAAVMGVYLHGFAGDEAARIHSRTSMIAGDIIDGLGSFFKLYEQTES